MCQHACASHIKASDSEDSKFLVSACLLYHCFLCNMAQSTYIYNVFTSSSQSEELGLKRRVMWAKTAGFNETIGGTAPRPSMG